MPANPLVVTSWGLVWLKLVRVKQALFLDLSRTLASFDILKYTTILSLTAGPGKAQ